MREVSIGLGNKKRLAADDVISTYRILTKPSQVSLVSTKELSRIFTNIQHFWETAQGIGELAYLELKRSGNVTDPRSDRHTMADGFTNGIQLCAATFSLIKLITDPSYKGELPEYSLPEDFEPKAPNTEFFVQENDDFSALVSQVTAYHSDNTVITPYGYDPSPTFTVGLEFGTQYLLECLALRHEELVARFELSNISDHLSDFAKDYKE